MAKLFTKEQHDYLVSIIKGRRVPKLVTMMDVKFGLKLTDRQIRTYKKNHNLKSEVDCQFKKGHEPINKGSIGLYNVGGNKTSFKPGQRPKNYKPIGHERIDRDGYTIIKVQDDGPWHKRWRHKHKLEWEKENGSVPEGHALLFLDGDKQNIDTDNLILISRKQLAILNRQGSLRSDADLNKLAITIADIKLKIGERTKKNRKGD